jgi:hypothetical protein
VKYRSVHTGVNTPVGGESLITARDRLLGPRPVQQAKVCAGVAKRTGTSYVKSGDVLWS